MDNFIKEIKATRLSDGVRARMRAELSAYADLHSAPEAAVMKSGDGRFIWYESRWSALALFTYPRKHMALFVPIMIALALGGGTSFAAERALPGDTLYPIKVEVNERVRSALTFSAEGEAELAARLAERRLAEAEKLIVEGRFDAETRAELETKIEARLNQADAAAERMAERGNAARAAEIRAQLSGSLNAHASILGALSAESQSDAAAGFVTNLRARTDADASTTEGRAPLQIEYTAENTNAAILRADMFVKETRAMFNRASANMNAELRARIEARIGVAETAIVNARAAVAAEAYARAHESVREAIRIAQEVQVIVRSSASIDANVDVSGRIDLYPMPYRPVEPADRSTSNDGTSGSIRIDAGANVSPSSGNSGGGVDGTIDGVLRLN